MNRAKISVLETVALIIKISTETVIISSVLEIGDTQFWGIIKPGFEMSGKMKNSGYHRK